MLISFSLICKSTCYPLPENGGPKLAGWAEITPADEKAVFQLSQMIPAFAATNARDFDINQTIKSTEVEVRVLSAHSSADLNVDDLQIVVSIYHLHRDNFPVNLAAKAMTRLLEHWRDEYKFGEKRATPLTIGFRIQFIAASCYKVASYAPVPAETDQPASSDS